jgi:hypothetical protein
MDRAVFSCQLGGNIFSGFILGAAGTGNPLIGGAASITVTPEVLSTGIGFRFSGNFSVAGTGSNARVYIDTIQYIVNAPVTSLPSWFVSATAKVNGGSVGNAGTYSETKTLYSDAARTIAIDFVPSVTNATAQTQSSAITGAPVITMYIKDQISLKSNSSLVTATAGFTSPEEFVPVAGAGQHGAAGHCIIGIVPRGEASQALKGSEG